MHNFRPFGGQPLTRGGWICRGCLEKVNRRHRSETGTWTLPDLHIRPLVPEQSLSNDEVHQNRSTPHAPSDTHSLLSEAKSKSSPKPLIPEKRTKIAKVQEYRQRAEPKDNWVRKRTRTPFAIPDFDGNPSQSNIRFHAVGNFIRTTSSAVVRYVKFQRPGQSEGELLDQGSRLKLHKYTSSTSITTRDISSKASFSKSPSTATTYGGLKYPKQQLRSQGGLQKPGSRSFSTSARISGLSAMTAKQLQTDQVSHPAPDLSIHERLRQYQKELNDAGASKKAALGLAVVRDPLDIYSIEAEDILEEDQPFQEDGQDATLEDEATLLRPRILAGDLIEVYLGGSSSLAVVTAVFNTGAGFQYQIVTSVGSWEHKVFTWRNTPSFVVRNYFEPSELARVKQFLPSTPTTIENRDQRRDEYDLIPPEISRSVTKKLQKFQKEAEDIYRLHATNIDNVSELLGKTDEAIFMRLEDITRKALRIDERPQDEALYAVHKVCTQYNAGFLLAKDHWHTRKFELLSKKEMRMVEQIRTWVREHSDLAISKANGHKLDEKSTIDKFAEEVRPIILESRKSRESLAGAHLGPFRLAPGDLLAGRFEDQVITEKQISSDALLIFSFIRLWAERLFDSPGTVILTALGSTIMKSIEVYGEEKLAGGRRESLSLLKECGVVPPWQMPTDRGGRLSNIYANANSQISRLFSQARSEVEADGHQNDTMSTLRHDWGSMPVYCIDSASTTEVDDGISLEKTSDSGVYWIHVHVANPTAFIAPDTSLSELAYELGHTIYLPHRMDKMLPFDVLRDRLSLHAGAPTLTFSTKINMEGMVLDRQIRNGRVNNVFHMTPETVAKHTEEPLFSAVPFNTYAVGSLFDKSPLTKHVTSNLSPDMITELQTMKTLCDAWIGRQVSARGQTWQLNSYPRASVQVHNLDFVNNDQSNFRRFLNDPTITYSAQPWSPYRRAPISRHGKRDLVQGAMQLANNTAAEWCSQRGIPTVFRGCQVEVLGDLSAEVTRPLQNSGHLSTDFEDFCRRFSTPKWQVRATLAPRKVAHELIGVDAYAWVTSPLRRYEDMVTHWQIEAALRQDLTDPGHSMTEYDASLYYFSRQKIKKQMRKSSETSVAYSLQLSGSEQYWTTEFLIRGALFGECQNLPELFTFYITSADQDFLRGYVAEIGNRAIVSTKQLDRVEKYPQVGQIWKAKPNKDDLTAGAIKWKLVERIA